MQKKYSLLALAFAFMLGTIVAALPPAKAQVDQVRFYVWNPATGTNIYPGQTFPPPLTVQIWIDSPPLWEGTPGGIVGYGLSVRVDPNVLSIGYAQKVSGQGGLLEEFIFSNFYNWPPYSAYTGFLYGEVDTVAGTIFDISENILSDAPLPGGAGGTMPLLEIVFMPLSETEPSRIDVFGVPTGAPPNIVWINAWYKTNDGIKHDVEVIEEGYYVSQIPGPAKIWFDSSPAFNPANPLHSDWHELSPLWCDWWTLESFSDDNGDGVLSASDQIGMQHSPEGTTWWFHVDWVNPNPLPGDGKADMRVTVKPDVPEYPLGVELMMLLALAIPIAYLLKTRKKVMK